MLVVVGDGNNSSAIINALVDVIGGDANRWLVVELATMKVVGDNSGGCGGDDDNKGYGRMCCDWQRVSGSWWRW